MTETVNLGPPLAVGIIVGSLFFGGLWWTVHRGLGTSRPALWFMASLLLRMAGALAALMWEAGQDWHRWLACLTGFAIARVTVTRMVRSCVRSHAP